MQKFLAAAGKTAMTFAILFMSLFATTAFAGQCPDFKTCAMEAVKASVDKCEAEAKKAEAALSAKPNAANFSSYEGAIEALERSKANARRVYARIAELKGNVAGEFKKVYDEIKALRDVDALHLVQLTKLMQRMGQVEQRVDTVERVRLPAVEAQAARAEAKADQALAAGGEFDGTVGLFTGNIVRGESGGVLGGCFRGKGSGNGACVAAQFGFTGLVGGGEVHPTSLLIKAGPTFRMGDAASPISLTINGVIGGGSKTSLSVDAAFVGGLSAALEMRLARFSGLPLVAGVEAGTLWGRFSGTTIQVMLGLDFGAMRQLTNSLPQQSAHQNAPLPPLAGSAQ